MNDSVAMIGQEFWLKPALKKAEAILAEGVIPLPEDHYLERFLVEEVQSKIEEQSSHQHSLVNKKLSVISEGLICYLINQGLIFGLGAQATKTNTYDDYIKHVDLVVELPSSPVNYLGIDVTYSKSLEKKFERIRRGVASGRLATLTYSVPTSKNRVPIFLLGFGLQNLCILARQWVEDPTEVAQSSRINLLRLQFEKQLESYADYAYSNKQFVTAKQLQQLDYYWSRAKSVQSGNTYRDDVTDIIMTELHKLSL